MFTQVTHVKGVKRGVCGFYARRQRHSEYAVRTHNIFTHNFLNIQPIFNPEKVLESLDLGLSNQMLCMSKHVKGVKGWNNFWPLQYASAYIAFDGVVGKV